MPRRARLTTYMTLDELAGLLGLPRDRRHKQKLRRHLKGRQRCTGANFLVRQSDAPNSPLLVTLASLRQHCPELFDRREEALEILRETIEELRQDALEGKARDKALAAAIRSLKAEVRDLGSCVKVRHGASPSGQG